MGFLDLIRCRYLLNEKHIHYAFYLAGVGLNLTETRVIDNNHLRLFSLTQICFLLSFLRLAISGKTRPFQHVSLICEENIKSFHQCWIFSRQNSFSRWCILRKPLTKKQHTISDQPTNPSVFGHVTVTVNKKTHLS